MPLRRLHRRAVAWLLAVCVLVAQSAAIAYACPRHAPAEVADEAPCARHLAAEGEPSPASGGLLANANLCEVHCHAMSLPDGGDVPVPPAATGPIWWQPPQPAVAVPMPPLADLEAKSASPPPRTLYVRLLI